jgi:hypothetical protein
MTRVKVTLIIKLEECSPRAILFTSPEAEGARSRYTSYLIDREIAYGYGETVIVGLPYIYGRSHHGTVRTPIKG